MAVLLGCPGLAKAEIVIYRVKRNASRGEFAPTKGVFSSRLNIAHRGEFKTRGVIPVQKHLVLKDNHEGEFKSTAGIFNSIDLGRQESGFGSVRNTFNSAGLMRRAQNALGAKGVFKAPDKGEFKFSLPKA